MIPDTSAGRGPTYLLKSTPKRLSRLRTGQQEVPGTSSMSWRLCAILGPSWSQHGFQHLAMLFYQQESKSCTDSPKPITSDSLYIHAYKYYATTGRQPIVDKLARKRFFSPKTPIKTNQAQKNYPIIRIPCECCVVY